MYENSGKCFLEQSDPISGKTVHFDAATSKGIVDLKELYEKLL